MGITIGPADWWVATPDGIDGLAVSCPLGTILPDKSVLIARDGGCAWIVAPSCTQVSSTWNGTTNTQVGDQCCVSSWATLCSQLISCGFNPDDWFVPCYQLLQNPGYVCRTNWDSFPTSFLWSSTEISATSACYVSYGNVFNCQPNCAYTTSKTGQCIVRAFRCVTY